MSKGAVGLTAGYWPENVYRYLAIPGISLDEALITRPARRTPDRPALIGPERTVTYRELGAETDQTVKALFSYGEGKPPRVALAVQEPLELARLIFAALRGRSSLFLMNPALASPELTAQLRQFGPDLVIADAAHLRQIHSLLQGVQAIQPEELKGKGVNLSVPRTRLDLQAPAVALSMENGGLVYHSHKSLLAGAVSWSTFVPLKAEDIMLVLHPLHQWEGLYSLLPILLRGGSCIMADLGDPERSAEAVRKHRPIYTILSRGEARKLYHSASRPLVQAFRESLYGLFVSTTGPFTALGRRRLRNLLEKPALLMYGSAECGPVLSSHPTWYLDAAVGMAITNVDVWPLNPADGNPLKVPWETIEYGEVGVKSPMIGVGYQTTEEREKHIREGWLRTKIVANMDPNGLFYIQSKVSD